MNKLVAILVILGFLLPMPVRAQISTDFDPVEKKLRTPMTLEEKMTEDFKKADAKPGEKPEEGSTWWKWALGALAVGAIAAAAGGGGGGGGGAAPPPSTGTVSGSW